MKTAILNKKENDAYARWYGQDCQEKDDDAWRYG